MNASRDFLERRGELELSSDPARIDRALIHEYLANESHWAAGVPESVIERALDMERHDPEIYAPKRPER